MKCYAPEDSKRHLRLSIDVGGSSARCSYGVTRSDRLGENEMN